MIASEFIEELRSIQHLYAWKLQRDGNWVGNRRSRPRLRIRASRYESEDIVMDPIGVVCLAKTGRCFNEESWIQAADAIELSMIDAADITAAANERTWKAEGDGRVMDPYLVSLRKRLMNSVGLEDHEDRARRVTRWLIKRSALAFRFGDRDGNVLKAGGTEYGQELLKKRLANTSAGTCPPSKVRTSV